MGIIGKTENGRERDVWLQFFLGERAAALVEGNALCSGGLKGIKGSLKWHSVSTKNERGWAAVLE